MCTASATTLPPPGDGEEEKRERESKKRNGWLVLCLGDDERAASDGRQRGEGDRPTAKQQQKAKSKASINKTNQSE